MKANELRIGNKIIFSEDGTIFTVGSIEEKGFMVQNEEETAWIESEEFEPIPLTEEWLLKFGFKEQESDIPTFAKVFGQIIEDDYEHCLIINKDIDDNFFVIVMGIKIIFKYVHQIQNLYFTLTGEELTYGGSNHLCCTPEGQIKRYLNCIGCDKKPLTCGGNK